MLTIEVIFTSVEFMLHNFHNESRFFFLPQCGALIKVLLFKKVWDQTVQDHQSTKYILFLLLTKHLWQHVFRFQYNVTFFQSCCVAIHQSEPVVTCEPNSPLSSLLPTKLVDLIKHVPEVRSSWWVMLILNTGFNNFSIIHVYCSLLAPPSSQGHYRNFEENECSV